MCDRFLSSLSRRKTVTYGESKLARVLTLFDLSALGVGSTLGLGVYVLAGAVAKDLAGPAVCISFAVAAFASAIAGICYAEFAARVPKTGSAYVYSYVSVGEFVAFVIGWNLILEHAIGTASVASGLSKYIDALAGKDISNYLTEAMPMNVSFLGNYPDILSFGFVILLTCLLCAGVKESTLLNNVFTTLNLTSITIVLISGAIKADTANWRIPKEEVKGHDAGEGGFAPWGFAGIMAGAAKCFYGFVGFDSVATTGEEAINPQRNIPIAIVIALSISFAAYFGISTVLTMMWPYYLQDSDAPFPHVFEELDWIAIKWIVTIGAIFALTASLLGAMFPLPRIIYAMSSDGIIFKWLAKIHPRTKTPIIATVISGFFAGTMSTIFNLQQLIDMISIGTLLAYTIVAICILVLRYKPHGDNANYGEYKQPEKTVEKNVRAYLALLFNLNNIKDPNSITSRVTNWSIGIFCIFACGFDAILIYLIHDLGKPFILVPFILVTIVMLMFIVVIYRQPIDKTKLSFMVPLVPFLPCISVIINLYLMLELNRETWIRFIVWLVIGFLIYFGYGISHSTEKETRAQLKLQKETENANEKQSSVATF